MCQFDRVVYVTTQLAAIYESRVRTKHTLTIENDGCDKTTKLKVNNRSQTLLIKLKK